MTETLSRHRAEQEQHQVDHEHVRSALGALSLDHAANLIASFHGGESHYFGRPLDQPNKINSIVSKTNEEGKHSNEVIAQGESVEEALYETFLGMRQLETVKTKPLMRMEIQKGVDVDFTTLEHYAPKVAPTAEAYPVPDHLKDLIEGNTSGRHTYDKTIEVEGWDKAIFSQVERFAQSERGTELIKDLKIQSLQTLTPEQAVKLTLSMVHDLSKYSYDETGDADLEAAREADGKTTMALLSEGFSRKDNPYWTGNGVCRNIASNVKAVFESLKVNQTDVNMLHNTYVGYTGSDEDFRIKKRQNRGDTEYLTKDEPGHAWNTFTTVDAKGDASVTIVDVTWSLSKSPEEAMDNMDYTLTRSARKARELFEVSADKARSFYDLNDYYKDFLRAGFQKHRQSAQFESMIQFAMSEYLKAAHTAITEADPEWVETGIPTAPGYIQGAAYRLGDNLEKGEFETLYQLSEAGAITNFDGIASSYIKGGKNEKFGSPTFRAEALAFPSQDELSKSIFEQLDDETIKAYADASLKFRVLARQYSPDSLPPFDPEKNFSDQKELAELASMNRINLLGGTNPRTIANATERGLLKAAGGNQELVDQVKRGRDLYTLVKDYPQMIEELSRDQG